MSNGSRCSPIRGSELSSVSPGLGLGASRRFLHLFDDGEAITPSRVSQPSLHAAIGPRASGSGLQEGSLGASFSPPAARKWGSFSGAFGQQSIHPRGQHQKQRPWNGSMDGSSASAIAPRPSAFGNASSIGGGSGAASPLRLTLSPRGVHPQSAPGSSGTSSRESLSQGSILYQGSILSELKRRCVCFSLSRALGCLGPCHLVPVNQRALT